MHQLLVRPLVFLDFDGTISRADVVDAVLERYADRAWTQIEDAWRDGRIGSRQCLRDQMALVRATPADLDALLDAIGIDEGFATLLETCASHELAVHVVSDGFDYCIERILKTAPACVQELIARVRICSSHLEPDGASRWRVGFPYFADGCAHGCATCKPAVMTTLNPAGGPSVFVGDGLSDRFAAHAADLVFAKQKLAAYCREQSLAHVPYATLADVASEIDRLMLSAGIQRAASIGLNR
jgi:2-hydroxy-3-keto-5-methylthiopentenyl-1-phosphate phosphatase